LEDHVRPRTGRPARAEDGFSLAEVLVTMGLMSVMMLLFTGAILQVYRTVQTTETLTEAQAQLAVSFQRFDRQLRYASWISEPGLVNGNTWYVEFAGLEGDKCRQLRLELDPAGSNGAQDQGVLQLLEWTPGSPPAAGSRGTTIAGRIDVTDISRTTAAEPAAPRYRPFDLQRADTKPYASQSVGSDFSPDFHRLRIHLKTRSAAGTAEIDTTFTALNTTRNTPATHTCSEGRP
jgi:hypothetical protein